MIMINNYALKTINYDELNMKNSSLDICSHSISPPRDFWQTGEGREARAELWVEVLDWKHNTHKIAILGIATLEIATSRLHPLAGTLPMLHPNVTSQFPQPDFRAG